MAVSLAPLRARCCGRCALFVLFALSLLAAFLMQSELLVHETTTDVPIVLSSEPPTTRPPHHEAVSTSRQLRPDQRLISFGTWRDGQEETWANTCKPYPGKRVILVQANPQYLDMFRNWLFHASSFLNPQTDQLVIAAESDSTVPAMKELSGLFGVHWDVQFIGASSEDDEAESTYGQGVWSKVVTHRPMQILQLLNQGCSVLYQDIDTVWTRPIFSVFDAAGKFDAYIASDNDNPKNRYLCTCLMYFHPTLANKQLMDKWKKKMTKRTKANQYPFNAIVNAMDKKRAIQFHVLSLKTFPPGKLAHEHNKTAAVLHANYVKGATGKVDFLKEYGYWNPTGSKLQD